MTYTVDVIEVRIGFKLDIELYRYSYIETPFLFSRRSCQISAFRRNPELCGIQDSDSPPHATIALSQAVIQKMESLALQWKHLKDPISLLTARLQVWLWQEPKSPRAHQPAPVKGSTSPQVPLSCTWRWGNLALPKEGSQWRSQACCVQL